MLELVYVQIILADGRVDAWSSSRGKLNKASGPLADIFKSLSPSGPSSKVMIHLIGDDDKVTDDERLTLMDDSKRAGFKVTRFEFGPPMEPEQAFAIMTLPFT